MKNLCVYLFFYSLQVIALVTLLCLPHASLAQCGTLAAVVTTTESRCAATGSIIINASGGANPQRYQYSIASGPVTTSFSLVNSFGGLPPGTYSVAIKDITANCTITKNNIVVTGNYVSPGILYNSSPPTCINGNDGTIFVTNQTGGRPPFTYKVVSPSPSNVGTTSSDGTFTGLNAGIYYIQLSDSCGGIQTRTQEVINYAWSILSQSSITASCDGDVTATIFLTNSNGVNSPSPAYNGFQYGISRFSGDTTWFPSTTFSYNIGAGKTADLVVKDVCGNLRSFHWSKPKPDVSNISVSNRTCTSFTATVTGLSNIYPDSTQYCLYDQTNTVLLSACQSSPVFNNLALGKYTIRTNETCYDTTLIRTVADTSIPRPSISDNLEYAFACKNYIAAAVGQKDTSNSMYCLYRNGNAIPDTCNTTGWFINLMYDSLYCLQLHNISPCIDTIINRCFLKPKPAPSVGTGVVISNIACTTFTAAIAAQLNITNATYQLFNSANDTQIGANQSSPIFNLLPYGSYCIRIKNDSSCTDTTFVRCFTQAAPKLKISLSSTGTCIPMGQTNVIVTFTVGLPPFTSSIYSPNGTLLNTATTSAGNYTFANMPVIPAGQLYKVVTKDLCGNFDSGTVAVPIYYFNRNFTMRQRCPTGSSPNGANDITFFVNENKGGSLLSTIIKRNGLVFNQNPTSTTNAPNSHTYYFASLLPAIYIFDNTSIECGLHLYDTVVVPDYVYPGLSNSTGYYCDNNSQNITFSAINGVPPYQYQIFGSVPASPDITTPLQTSPTFTISNGTSYSLIRLRVLDACLNASINDVGFVSLAVPSISVTNICYNSSSELSVDSLANATYAWYKRTYNPIDSIFLDSGNVYHVPNVSLADTGTYIAKTVANGGCVTRLSYLTLYTGTNTCLSLHLNSKTDTSVCSSELPYIWNGIPHSTTGSYDYATTNLAGIDSIATLNLTVKDTSISTTNLSVCNSAIPYTWNGKLYYDSGMYVYHTLNSVGCDSAATLILKLKDTSTSITNVAICASAAPYIWNGNSYSTSTTTTHIFTNAVGCDSTAILKLVINDLTTGDTTAVACSSFNWYGNTYSTTTTTTHIFTNAAGCDSIVTLHLTINNPTTGDTTAIACSSFNWYGNTYNNDTAVTHILSNAAGCDSTVTLHLTINNPTTGDTTAVACTSFTWYGNTYSGSSTATHIFTNAAGCDSTVTLHLTINNTTTGDTLAVACSSFTWYGNTYSTSATPTHIFTNAVGCDSTVTLHLTINDPTTGDTTAIACSSFTWYGNTYNNDTAVTHIFTNAAGCDSTVTLHLTINNTTTGDTTAVACSSFTWYRNTYNNDTAITHVLTNAVGCDSIVTLHLTINNPSTGDTTAIACSSFTWYSNTYTTSANPTHTFTNAAGCDSIVTLHLTINNPTTGDTLAVACSSFTWYGNTYSTSVTPTHTFTNAAGCDSIVTLHLVINNPTTGNTLVVACSSFTWYGNTYSTSATPTHSFTNAAGCDSIVTLHLTINNTTTGDTSAVACSSFTWYSNTYSTSATPTHTFTNAAGCDSIVTLHLTINNITTGDTTAVACSSFTWYGNTYSASSTPTHIFTNAVGCDSIVTLHLTINNTTTGDTLAVACSSFTWYGNTYSTSAAPTHTFTNAAGCDSIVTLHLTINNTTTGDTIAVACNSFTWYGNAYSGSTTATHILTNATGCDSTVTLHLTINTPTISSSSINVCPTALPYSWNGLTFTTAGTQTAHLLNSTGCDSAATLTVTTFTVSTSSTDHTACSAYTWNGITYTGSGTYTYATINSLGCDSVATLHLTINQPTSSSNSISICPSELPYTWNGLTFTTAGTQTAHLLNSTGCDSAASLTVIVKAVSSSTTNHTECSSYTWNGTTYTGSGTYTYNTLNSVGCDSVATLKLTITQPTLSSSLVNICPSALPYTWNGLTFTGAGTQTAHLINNAGCDSAATLTVTMKTNTASTTNISICPSALPFTWNNTSFTNAGPHVVTLINAAGCDSLATLILTVKQNSTSTTKVSICEDAFPYRWNGNNYSTGGTYTITLANAAGCDSLASLVLTALSKTSGTYYANTCETALPFNWNGNAYNSSGTYTVHLLNAAGCDSSANLVLTVNAVSTSITKLTVCEDDLPYTWNGHTFNAAGNYTATLVNAAGCDSLASVVLATESIIPASLGSNKRICPNDSIILYPGKYATYLWQDGSTNPTYTASRTGKYSVTVSNGQQCTSITSVNVLVLDRCDDIFFPTAITPNSDGLNDAFGALGELAGVSEYTLQIYNRYGELVFKTNDPYARWDGSYKGAITATNNYVWYSTYTLNHTKHRMQKGNVVVIR